MMYFNPHFLIPSRISVMLLFFVAKNRQSSTYTRHITLEVTNMQVSFAVWAIRGLDVQILLDMGGASQSRLAIKASPRELAVICHLGYSTKGLADEPKKSNCWGSLLEYQWLVCLCINIALPVGLLHVFTWSDTLGGSLLCSPLETSSGDDKGASTSYSPSEDGDRTCSPSGDGNRASPSGDGEGISSLSGDGMGISIPSGTAPSEDDSRCLFAAVSVDEAVESDSIEKDTDSLSSKVVSLLFGSESDTTQSPSPADEDESSIQIGSRGGDRRGLPYFSKSGVKYFAEQVWT
eukprot:1649344-Ditylum_brightwellii.AAC.2